MQTAKILSISEHRGNPRFWTEGGAPLRAGFEPGAHYEVVRHGQGLLVRLADDGRRKVARKERKGKVIPVLDLNSESDMEPFKGLSCVRVVFGPGQVYITPLASEIRRQRRLNRLKSRLDNNEPLQTVGIAAGGGVLSHAVHRGFTDAGVAVTLRAHNEIREDLTEHAMEHNDILNEETQLLNMPLQELAFDTEVMRRVGEVDVAELGLPCSGASVAGRAKRSLGMPEEHPDVGHLVAGALALLAQLNPSVAIFENVVPYASSASAVLIRQQLRDLGYDCHERELYGPDFGAFEARTRWCLVAVTRGIEFDFNAMAAPGPTNQPLSDVLEPLADVADRWSEMTGLKAKQERDIEAGKGFRMQIYTGQETAINTLTKGIAKNRSTDPKIQHPEHPELLRIPTAKEHARIKGVPEHLIEGLPQTTAHELLGQGIVYNTFRHVAMTVASSIRTWHRKANIEACGIEYKAAA